MKRINKLIFFSLYNNVLYNIKYIFLKNQNNK